jgi:hypothetical protein
MSIAVLLLALAPAPMTISIPGSGTLQEGGEVDEDVVSAVPS